MAGVVERGAVDAAPGPPLRQRVIEHDGHLRWAITELFDGVRTGLRAARRRVPRRRVDRHRHVGGRLRPARRRTASCSTDPIVVPRRPHERRRRRRSTGSSAPSELYAINGLQFLPFNTLYQLAADQRGGRLGTGRARVLIPDLLAYWLTGELRTEVTNASTTGLSTPAPGGWSGHCSTARHPAGAAAADRSSRATVRARCARRAPTARPAARRRRDDGRLPRHRIGGRRPCRRPTAAFAYIASGTWSLVGLELDAPIITEASRDGQLHQRGRRRRPHPVPAQLGGLWLLQESMRAWADEGARTTSPACSPTPRDCPAAARSIDVDDPAFIPPGDMPDAHRRGRRRGRRRPPSTPAAITRCIVDSLADAYARRSPRRPSSPAPTSTSSTSSAAAPRTNCSASCTADAAGVPVAAGPVEATALGNVLVQARAHGAVPASLDEIREQLATSR